MISSELLRDRRGEFLSGDVVEMATVEPPYEGVSEAGIF